MALRVLITTTSFQDTPGNHHELLAATGWEVEKARGPLSEHAILALVGDVDGLLCGDDAITPQVIEKALPRLKGISKYGIGVDKIDLAAARDGGIPVCYTPGVNHITVAEHTFALLLALRKNLVEEVDLTRQGSWKRLIGHEIYGQTLGIVGLGRIGKEVALRATAFGLRVIAFDTFWPADFAREHGITPCSSVAELLREADIISLHTSLSDETRGMIDAGAIETIRPGAIILNCARGELVDPDAVVAGLQAGKIGGYGTDVLEREPPPPDHPLLHAPRCIVTPHIASRTYESVVRQATMSLQNLQLVLEGKEPLAAVT